jgi:hypothetical protein
MPHTVAERAAQEIILEAMLRGLEWADIMVMLNRTVGDILVHCAAKMATDKQARIGLARELAQALCEQAQEQAVRTLMRQR